MEPRPERGSNHQPGQATTSIRSGLGTWDVAQREAARPWCGP